MICSTCKNTELILIGKLRDCHNFAGQQLDNAIFGGSLYKCKNCELKFKHPILSQNQYKLLYDNNSQANWDQLNTRNDWKLIADYIHNNNKESGCILDFGCDTGKLLFSLNNNYEKYGVELNNDAAKSAAESNKCLVWESLGSIPDELRFNAIILSDVIEHVTDPSVLIASLNEKLAVDGVLILTTGDANNAMWRIFGANWWYCAYPEHISFISKEWINYICNSTKMTTIKFQTFRYSKLHIFKYCIDFTLMCLYGLFPKTYNIIGSFIKRMLNKPGDVPVRGVGISKDHIFIVLKKSNLNEI